MKKTVTPQCRYALLTTVLQREIAAGRFAIGSSLPTEAELCEQFNVSRCTVREALRQLRAMGMVASKQGSGTTVIADKPTAKFVHSLDSIEDFMEFLRQARPEVLSADMRTLPAALAKACDLPENSRQLWIHIQLLRYWGDLSLPTLLVDGYVDAKYSAIKDAYDATMPLTETLEQLYGVAVNVIQQDIQAIALNQEQSELLKSPIHAPAMQAIRRCYTDNGELVVISCNISPAERYTYSTRMRIGS